MKQIIVQCPQSIRKRGTEIPAQTDGFLKVNSASQKKEKKSVKKGSKSA